MPIDPGSLPADRIRLRRVLRLAAGTTVALWLSQAVAWQLSFVAPVLTLVILALPVSRPPASLFVKIVAALILSVYGSFVFLPMLVHQRIAGLILVALALFHTFYLTARGKPAAIGTFFTIGITVTVALGSVSVDVLLAVAEGLAIGAIVGAGIAWLMHIVLPDPPLERPPAKPPAPPPDFPVRRALRSLVVVLPVTIWFLLSPASASNVGVMIKVAAMGQEASGAGAGGAAKSLIVSTLAGGLAAIIGWELLAVWPSLTMYVAVCRDGEPVVRGPDVQGRRPGAGRRYLDVRPADDVRRPCAGGPRYATRRRRQHVVLRSPADVHWRVAVRRYCGVRLRCVLAAAAAPAAAGSGR